MKPMLVNESTNEGTIEIINTILWRRLGFDEDNITF